MTIVKTIANDMQSEAFIPGLTLTWTAWSLGCKLLRLSKLLIFAFLIHRRQPHVYESLKKGLSLTIPYNHLLYFLKCEGSNVTSETGVK